MAVGCYPAGLLAVALLAGCDYLPPYPGRPCETERYCATGAQCIDVGRGYRQCYVSCPIGSCSDGGTCVKTTAGAFCGPAICNFADECLPIGTPPIQSQSESPVANQAQPVIECLVVDSKGCAAGSKCIALESYNGTWLEYDPSRARCAKPGNAGLFDKCKTSANCGMDLICSGGITGGGSTGYRCLELCTLGNPGTCSYGHCHEAEGFNASLAVGVCAIVTGGQCSGVNSSSSPCQTCGGFSGDCNWCAFNGKGFCAEDPSDCGKYLNQTDYVNEQWTTKCP